ncbi:Hypothetical predicted protein [Octopus vulgaris]|uniref:Uncharacterized protein n=1 Tax=Octopus vulgaris TaxID=6645 RepID=A0AA36FC49_OCTVU|nr:Hypothetical predicted protein [Octopus vulgaris]
MDYEEVIGTIGGCGLYQKLTLAFLFSATIMDGLQIGSMIFIVPDLNYRCAIPGYDNDTYKIQSEIHEELINEYIPKSEDEGEVVYDKCLIYSNTTENGNRTTQKCSSWVYDKTNTHTSITTQLNLVCDDAILARHTITIFFMGFLFAMVGCGILSDRFGRKKVIIDLDYADDIAILGETFADVQLAINEPQRVASMIGMKVNASKTKILTAGFAPPDKTPIVLNGDIFEEGDCELGILWPYS